MPELLSYWLPLDDAKVMCRYLNDQIAQMIAEAPEPLRRAGSRAAAGLDAAMRELEYCKEPQIRAARSPAM